MFCTLFTVFRKPTSVQTVSDSSKPPITPQMRSVLQGNVESDLASTPRAWRTTIMAGDQQQSTRDQQEFHTQRMKKALVVALTVRVLQRRHHSQQTHLQRHVKHGSWSLTMPTESSVTRMTTNVLPQSALDRTFTRSYNAMLEYGMNRRHQRQCLRPRRSIRRAHHHHCVLNRQWWPPRLWSRRAPSES